MAHAYQIEAVKIILQHLGPMDHGSRVLEIGSHDVNGTIRHLFPNTHYIGVDLSEGPGVDIVMPGDKLTYEDGYFDAAISVECFEHNPQWKETLANMVRMTKPGGFVLVTCATTGRLEHGTVRTSPEASPGTQSVGWNYYRNVGIREFTTFVRGLNLFENFVVRENKRSSDLYFVGLKGHDSRFILRPADLLAALAKSEDEIYAGRPKYPHSLIAKVVSSIFEMPVQAAKLLPDSAYQDFCYSYYKALNALKDKAATIFLRKPRGSI